MILEIEEEEFNAFMSAFSAFIAYVGNIEPLAAMQEDNRTAKQG